MPRRRRQPEPVAHGLEVPEPLTSLEHPAWSDRRAVARMLADLGRPGAAIPDGPAARMLAVVDAWAHAHGLQNPRCPQIVDHARLRALGIYRPSARDRLRRAAG